MFLVFRKTLSRAGPFHLAINYIQRNYQVERTAMPQYWLQRVQVCRPLEFLMFAHNIRLVSVEVNN